MHRNPWWKTLLPPVVTASGIEAKVRDIMIPLEQTQVANLVYDMVVFYTRILQIQDNEFRVQV